MLPCYCILLIELNRVQLLCVLPVSFTLALVSSFTGLSRVKSWASPQCEAPRTVPHLCKAHSGLPNCWSPFCIPAGREREHECLLLSHPALHTCPTHQTQAMAPLQLAFSAKNCPGRHFELGERCLLFLRDFPSNFTACVMAPNLHPLW